MIDVSQVYVTASKRAIEGNIIPVDDCKDIATLLTGVLGVAVERTSYRSNSESIPQVIVYCDNQGKQAVRATVEKLPRALQTNQNGVGAYVFRQQ